MGYPYFGWHCGVGGEEFVWRVEPGPNQKNDLKLALMQYRKNDNRSAIICGVTHIISVERRTYRDWRNGGCVEEDVIVGRPTPEYKEELEQCCQDYIESERNAEDTMNWRQKDSFRKRPKGPRKLPGWGKQDLNEEDILEEKLSKPRCRYQRGWKESYRPTHLRRYARDDLKNWKRYGKRRKAWQD